MCGQLYAKVYKLFSVGILLLLWLLIEEFKVENIIKGERRSVEKLVSKGFKLRNQIWYSVDMARSSAGLQTVWKRRRVL